MKSLINTKGFTLIELMVAVAIVGILAAIAIPSYQDSMRKSRRADAQGALMNFANGMERHYTEVNTYCDASQWGTNDCGGGDFDYDGAPITSIYSAPAETAANYSFIIFFANQSSFTLRAIPVDGSAQSGNGILELDSTGVRRWDRNNNGDATEAGENTWD